MSKKITKLILNWNNPIQVEKTLQDNLLKTYELKSFARVNEWEISSKKFKHSLFFKPDKESQIISVRKNDRLKWLVSGIIIVAYFILRSFIGDEIETAIPFALLLVMVLSFSSQLIGWVYPPYKQVTDKEHQKIVAFIKSINQ